MHADLDKVRKTMSRLWAKRDQQIRGVIEAAAGMCGDLKLIFYTMSAEVVHSRLVAISKTA